ncbi:hypothetical protein ACU635_59230 [[Actinomadura] parvosata]|uniref:hypothetical protein n=1 Tax=[Actinomadura] parvosata TaxID=1955412 RepID=UPI00406C2A16
MAKAAGLDRPQDLGPRVLRTSAISHLLDKGEPIQHVRAKVGHSSPDTTFDYWRRTGGLERDAALSALLAAELPVGDRVAELRARHDDQGEA